MFSLSHGLLFIVWFSRSQSRVWRGLAGAGAEAIFGFLWTWRNNTQALLTIRPRPMFTLFSNNCGLINSRTFPPQSKHNIQAGVVKSCLCSWFCSILVQSAMTTRRTETSWLRGWLHQSQCLRGKWKSRNSPSCYINVRLGYCHPVVIHLRPWGLTIQWPRGDNTRCVCPVSPQCLAIRQKIPATGQFITAFVRIVRKGTESLWAAIYQTERLSFINKELLGERGMLL